MTAVRSLGLAAALAIALLSGPARGQEGERESATDEKGEPINADPTQPRGTSLKLRSPDGRFSIAPSGDLQFDFGAYTQQRGTIAPWGFLSNARRLRLGVDGNLGGGLNFTFLWNFAAPLRSYGSIDTAVLSYGGLKPLNLVAGVFKPRFTLDNSTPSNDLVFLERAAIADVATSLAAGSARVGAGAEANGGQWFAAAYVTGGAAGSTGPAGDSRERGVVLRGVILPYRANGIVVHLGPSASWQFNPARSAAGDPTIRLAGRPELRLDADSLVSTGDLRATGARSAGFEAAASWGRLQAQGEYHRVTVDRAGGDPSGRFEGWYAQVSWVPVGVPRVWSPGRAVWRRPKPDDAFNPAAGLWGAVELGLRYSQLNLNDRDVRGDRQDIVSASLNWYPTEGLKATLQVQNGDIRRASSRNDRRFQSVAMRLQFVF